MIVQAFVPDSDTPIMLRIRPIRVQVQINGFLSLIDLSRDDARILGERLLTLAREIGAPSPPSRNHTLLSDDPL